MSQKRPGPKKRSVHPLEAKVSRLYGEAQAFASSTDSPLPLPEVELPAPGALQVRVPPPAPLTEDELLVRYQALLRERAPRRERAQGEPIALGDEVLLDLLGYAEQALIPGSVRLGTWMDLEPWQHLPGFAETLEGTRVGDACALDLDLPLDYPVSKLAGKQARFLCEVLAASEVQVQDLGDPEAFLALGLGDTVDEAMEGVARLLEEEKGALDALQVQEAVLDALAERSRIELPAALVDEELRRRWAQTEAPLLQKKGFGPDELEEALGAWLGSEELRADAQRRLRISLALEAVGQREGLELTPEAVRQGLEQVAEMIGVDLPEAAAAVDREEGLARRVALVARHLMLVSHVVEQAQITRE